MTMFVFQVRNIPAALYKALGGFATNGINMTKLESYMVDGSFTVTRSTPTCRDTEGSRTRTRARRTRDRFTAEYTTDTWRLSRAQCPRDVEIRTHSMSTEAKVRRTLQLKLTLPAADSKQMAAMIKARCVDQMFGNARVRLSRNVDDRASSYKRSNTRRTRTGNQPAKARRRLADADLSASLAHDAARGAGDRRVPGSLVWRACDFPEARWKHDPRCGVS